METKTLVGGAQQLRSEEDAALADRLADGLRSLAAVVERNPGLSRSFYSNLHAIGFGVSTVTELAGVVQAMRAAGANVATKPGQVFPTIMCGFWPLSLLVFTPHLDDADAIPADQILAQLELLSSTE